jgi:hypothetical protein
MLNATAQTSRFNILDWQARAATEIKLLPMYGPQPKTEEQQLADKIFLEKMDLSKIHKDIRYRSDGVAEDAWLSYYSGALDVAMFRFNQAWLIDSTSIAPFIGFATIYATLGDFKMSNKMFQFVKKKDTITASEYQQLITQNLDCFRKQEHLSSNLISEYQPIDYYATGQLYLERKKMGIKYDYKWHYKNGVLLRQAKGGADPQNCIGKGITYHDNGAIAYKGKWKNTFFIPSTWTSYDREGKVSQIEYWRRSFPPSISFFPFSFPFPFALSANYSLTKTIIYSQEIPWKKGSYSVISESDWIKEDAQSVYPDGYIQEVYDGKDHLYKYYAIWKDGKASKELIKMIPPDCQISNAEGDFEWFEGKLYKLK